MPNKYYFTITTDNHSAEQSSELSQLQFYHMNIDGYYP